MSAIIKTAPASSNRHHVVVVKKTTATAKSTKQADKNKDDVDRRFSNADEKLYDVVLAVYQGKICIDDLKASSKYGVGIRTKVQGLMKQLPEGLVDNEETSALSRSIWNLVAPASPKGCIYTGKELQLSLKQIISGELKQAQARERYGVPIRTSKRYLSDVMRNVGVSHRTDLRGLWNEATGDGRERIINAIRTLYPDRKKRGNRPMLSRIQGSMIAAAVNEIVLQTGKSITSKEVRETLSERIIAQGQQELKDAQARGDVTGIKRAQRKIKAKVSKNFMSTNQKLLTALSPDDELLRHQDQHLYCHENKEDVPDLKRRKFGDDRDDAMVIVPSSFFDKKENGGRAEEPPRPGGGRHVKAAEEGCASLGTAQHQVEDASSYSGTGTTTSSDVDDDEDHHHDRNTRNPLLSYIGISMPPRPAPTTSSDDTMAARNSSTSLSSFSDPQQLQEHDHDHKPLVAVFSYNDSFLGRRGRGNTTAGTTTPPNYHEDADVGPQDNDNENENRQAASIGCCFAVGGRESQPQLLDVEEEQQEDGTDESEKDDEDLLAILEKVLYAGAGAEYPHAPQSFVYPPRPRCDHHPHSIDEGHEVVQHEDDHQQEDHHCRDYFFPPPRGQEAGAPPQEQGEQHDEQLHHQSSCSYYQEQSYHQRSYDHQQPHHQHFQRPQCQQFHHDPPQQQQGEEQQQEQDFLVTRTAFSIPAEDIIMSLTTDTTGGASNYDHSCIPSWSWMESYYYH
jgi:hypothetical protein